MKEVYERLHKTNEDWINEKRRARDYQAACVEKDKALKLVVELLEKYPPEDWNWGPHVLEVVKKALE
jgi:hypothetical protein